MTREEREKRVAALREMAAQGMTQAEAARALGVTREAVRSTANRHGISGWRDGWRDPKDPERLAKMWAGRDAWAADLSDIYRRHAAAGLTEAETARAMHVSREAVRQAKHRLGLTFRDGRRKAVQA